MKDIIDLHGVNSLMFTCLAKFRDPQMTPEQYVDKLRQLSKDQTPEKAEEYKKTAIL